MLTFLLIVCVASQDSCAWSNSPTEGVLWKGDHEGRWSDQLITSRVKRTKWNPRWVFADTISNDREPVILTNTAIKKWPALKKWDPDYLASLQDLEILTEVKRGEDSVFFDVDQSSEMWEGNVSDPLDDFFVKLPYELKTMSGEYFFDMVSDEEEDRYHYWFGSANKMEQLKADLYPLDMLWVTPEDEEVCYLTLWLSSAGPRQHTHFDSDHNFFVQVSGTKRFVLASPDQHEFMYTFPRVHPMWHKSQVDYDNPDLEAFPSYRNASFVEAILHPGDVLYIPPYWWHHVESVTPSISLAAWSRGNVFAEMSAVYNFELPSDTQTTKIAKRAAVKSQIDFILEGLYGDDANAFVASMLSERYVSTQRHFEEDVEEGYCDLEIDMASFVEASGANLRAIIARFDRLDKHIRDINVMDYIELMASWNIGVHDVYRFFKHCFPH